MLANLMVITKRRIFRSVLLLAIAAGFSGAANAQVTITSADEDGISGTAVSTSSITSIDVGLSFGGLWWNGSGFQSAFIRVPVNSTGSATSKNWSLTFTPALSDMPNLPNGGTGRYSLNVRANASGGAQSASRSIFVDDIPPTSSITQTSSSVISGTASDDVVGVGLRRVEIALRKAARNDSDQFEFWDGSSFLSGVYSRQVVNLQANGNWSYSINPSLPPGNYVVSSVALDLAGNVQDPFDNQFFTVAAPVVRPTSTISSTSASTISGTASDNVAVARVELAIRDNSKGTFFDGLGFGTYERVVTTLTGSGSSVSWAYNFPSDSDLEVGDDYTVVAIAFDVQGNAQMPFTVQRFTVQPPAAPLRIMAIGDSITEGFDWPGDGLSQNIRSYRGEFVNLMNNSSCAYQMVGSLQSNFPTTGFTSNHEGYSGFRADHLNNGFSDGRLSSPGISSTMAIHNPDVVLLHVGSNDMLGGQSILSTIADIELMIDNILAANPGATVLVANVIPWYSPINNQFNSNIRGSIAQLGNDIIASLQNNPRPNVRLANVRNGFTPSMMQGDLIHPNALGEVHIANAFFDALDGSGRCGPPGTL